MEGRKMKIFGVVMTLLLALSMVAAVAVSTPAAAGTQKWTEISIPGEDDMQLYPGSDVGAIAVSPDGATLFAAALDEGAGTWELYKSVDDGYTWKGTGFTDDGFDVVAIGVSPVWENDDTIIVATENEVYLSLNRGKDFTTIGVPGGTISSMDVGLDDNGNVIVVAGTSIDVYLLKSWTGWTAQNIATPYSSWGGVLAVAFSPNYADDGAIFAAVNGQHGLEVPALGDRTILRAETDIDTNNWGAYINDALFYDEVNDEVIQADSACIDFPDDYDTSSVFVGLTAYQTLGNTSTPQRGDAFRVDLVTSVMGTSVIEDLDIRGAESCTNVWSLQVSGDASSAFILAGLRHLSNTGSFDTWQGQVHWSQNAGDVWLQAFKPPAGFDAGSQTCTPTLVMAPDFADSNKVYCGNGYEAGMNYTFSGFYVSTEMGRLWNGRGLLDHSIDSAAGDAIADIVPSPEYAEDQTLFMVTSWSGMGDAGLLWETKDAGATWELILSMTAMVPLPGLKFNSIEIPSSYPTDPSVFVNGPIDFYANPANLFIRSLDEGASFASTIGGPSIGATVQVVSAWAAIDKDTIIAASGSGVWKTTDAGAHWYQEDDTEVDAAETIIDLVLYDDTSVLIGTDQGNVYICDDWSTDFTFTQVDAGPGTVAADEARVAFDANFGDNGMIYAGINGDPTTAGVWRIDINSGDKWEQINDWGNILSIACADNGNLWAIADDGVVPFSTTMRCVSPTVDITKLAWEWVADDLTTNLVTDLELAPGSTHVFAIGNDGVQNIELWTYLDTLIKPTLLSPADGATAGDIIESDLWEGNARVLLTWEDFAKADLYQVQVALDEDFGSLVVDPTLTLAGTTAEVYLFLGEQYYWRVRVDEADPVYSQWSDTWSFFTPLGPGHARPILSSPTAGQEDVMLKPALQWSATVDATNYELIVAANCNWDDPVIDKTGAAKLGSETAFQITADLNEGTTYCWKVRGVSATTYSPWSDTGTFTTMTTPDVEEDSTPVWVWVVIALSAVLLVGVIVLIVRTRRPV